MKTECPVCGALMILLSGTIEGELFPCRECGSQMEVVSLDPVVVAEAAAEEEDWGQ
ncbi:MAG: lysine biosynthesis protein LysW [Acidobacteria bacterium]|nr:lysine biosynthesis protein LysW [Acidobacteriota bacterium]